MPSPGMYRPKSASGRHGGGNQHQRLVEDAGQEPDHPDGDHDRDPDQQPRDQVIAETRARPGSRGSSVCVSSSGRSLVTQSPQRLRRRTAGARRAGFVRPFDFDRTAVVVGRLLRLRLPLPVGSEEALFAESAFADRLRGSAFESPSLGLAPAWRRPCVTLGLGASAWPSPSPRPCQPSRAGCASLPCPT